MQAINMGKLQKRIISAALLGPLALWVIYLGDPWYLVMVALSAGIVVFEWAQLSRKTGRLFLPLTLAGLFYIAFSGYMIWLFGQISWQIAMLFFVLVWVSDTGAYFFGKLIGGPKLLAKISPNKTWAGLAGAMVVPGLIMLAVLFLHEGNLKTLKTIIWFTVGAAFGVFCQIGDLIVSGLKRLAKQKDCGTLIPGHGGLLDRIDSVLLASYFYMGLWMYLVSNHFVSAFD